MKEYRLANKNYKNINLSEYEAEIHKAVRLVKPSAIVNVTNTGFTVEPQLTKRESIAVSIILRAGVMNEFTSYRPCLFLGYNIDDKEKESSNG